MSKNPYNMNIKCILYILPIFFILFAAKAQSNKTENISYDEKILFLEDMQKIQVHNIDKYGTNYSIMYQDKNGKLWFVKKMDNKSNTQNSLVSSYLASKLINFILPGSAPIILPIVEKKTGKVFIASLMLDNFQRRKGNEKNLILLNLILDLLGIEDRRDANVGGILNGNEVNAAAVDLDVGLYFWHDWLQSNWFQLAKSKNIDEVESSLKKIAQISDDDLKALLSHAIHDLQAIAPRLIPFAKYKFEVMIDFSYIVDQAITTKHEMDYLAQNIKLLSEILNPEDENYCEDITEDKYSILLQAAIIEGKDACIQELFNLGAKDSQGYAIATALQERHMYIAQQLLDQGAQDPQGHALLAAVRMGKWDFAQQLLEHGSRDPLGNALYISIKAGNITFAQQLLSSGAQDSYGNALMSALEIKNLEFAQKLLDQGSRDRTGKVLALAIEQGNWAFAQKLLDYGLQDLRGRALALAIEKENWAFAQKLLDHGSQDFYGHALKAAIQVGNLQFAEKLLNYDAQDPEGYALAAALKAGNLQFAQKLLDHASQDPQGLALLEAIQLGDFQFAQKLLEYISEVPEDAYENLLRAIKQQSNFNQSQKEQLIQKISAIKKN